MGRAWDLLEPLKLGQGNRRSFTRQHLLNITSTLPADRSHPPASQNTLSYGEAHVAKNGSQSQQEASVQEPARSWFLTSMTIPTEHQTRPHPCQRPSPSLLKQSTQQMWNNNMSVCFQQLGLWYFSHTVPISQGHRRNTVIETITPLSRQEVPLLGGCSSSPVSGWDPTTSRGTTADDQTRLHASLDPSSLYNPTPNSSVT